MFNFDYIMKEDIKEYNPNWTEIPDHPYRKLISWRFWIWKNNRIA